MTDFLSTYGLHMPVQYVVMTYFSSSVNYVNAIQVVWYYGRISNQRSENMAGNLQYKDFNDETNDTERQTLCSKRFVQPHFSYRTKRTIRYLFISLFVSFLCLFSFGIVWATKSYFAIFAPVTLVSVTAFAFIYYRRTWKSEIPV
jgi:hypothetical protein